MLWCASGLCVINWHLYSLLRLLAIKEAVKKTFKKKVILEEEAKNHRIMVFLEKANVITATN